MPFDKTVICTSTDVKNDSFCHHVDAVLSAADVRARVCVAHIRYDENTSPIILGSARQSAALFAPPEQDLPAN